MKFFFIIAAIVLVGGAVAFFAFSDHRVEAAQTKNKGASMVEFQAAQKEFLVENAKKPGWKTTPSGLQYHVITEIKDKSAPRPAPGSVVKVHYEGTLIDGTVFDSSVERKEPVSFGVSGVIPGWTEALQLMKEGDKWQLFIPAKLAYGEQSPGATIPPNSTLIFEVELLSIEPQEAK